MAFPPVIVECAFNSILGEGSAQAGYTNITKYVESISGTLRGRTYELDQVETGSISIGLDNADGRFTPGSPNSPYFPYVKANRRVRIRGNNLQQLNIARGGGQEGTTAGFFRDLNSPGVSEPALVTHNPVTLGFTGDLLNETTHIEATLATGAVAGSYRVLSYWAPVELGVRETHTAYVWLVSGTEPTGTKVSVINTYYDSSGTELARTAGRAIVEWAKPTPSTPTRRALADLPPGDAAYMIQSVQVLTTATTTTNLVYAVCGIQSEIPAANLVPSISGWFDTEAWEMTGGGTVASSGASSALAVVLATWAADSVELSTTVPHLVPGDRYTFVVEAQKNSGPNILMTGDDGLTGVTLSANGTWTTLRTSFTSPRAQQPIKFIPQGATTGSNTLQLRLARLSTEDPALALATSAIDTNETAWAQPIPVFDGRVERWPVKLTPGSSTISITVNDRMKTLGELVMESTLKQTIMTDNPSILMPFADSLTDSQGEISILGDWSDESDQSQLTPTVTKYGAGAATFAQGGVIGPTGEDAVLANPVSATQGYVMALPYFVTTPVTPPAMKPVPKPPVVATYSKTYYATWSRSYTDTNATRFDDPDVMYQGTSLAAGDTTGNQRSLIGFNWPAIAADLAGASVTGMTISLYALHWYSYAGGTAYLGTTTITTKPSTLNPALVTARRWSQARWPRNQWRNVNCGAAGGVLFQTGAAKGLILGWGDSDHETYGYFSGANMSHRPQLTITFKV